MTGRRRASDRALAAVDAHEAAVYDQHVAPRYDSLFGRALIEQVPQDSRLTVLDVGCKTGYPSLEVLGRLGEGSRVIALDRDPLLVEMARRRAGDQAGRRAFFKAEAIEDLSFGDQVFDLVVSNVALRPFHEPEPALRQIKRVLTSGGRLLMTQPLAGTFEEVWDMFRELAVNQDQPAIAERLERAAAHYPSPAELERTLTDAGFRDVQIQATEHRVAFESAPRLFGDPMIRLVALSEWEWVAGSPSMLEQVRHTLDTYFGRGPLTLRVSAGLACATS